MNLYGVTFEVFDGNRKGEYRSHCDLLGRIYIPRDMLSLPPNSLRLVLLHEQGHKQNMPLGYSLLLWRLAALTLLVSGLFYGLNLFAAGLILFLTSFPLSWLNENRAETYAKEKMGKDYQSAKEQIDKIPKHFTNGFRRLSYQLERRGI